jgi:hypothetical protein
MTGSTVFVLTILVGVTVVGGIFAVTNHPAPAQTTAPGPYAADEDQTTQNSTQAAVPIAAAGVPPLPSSLLGVAPEIDVYYDNMPFTGEQGSYCWAGNADTVQNDTSAPRTCQTVPSPAQMSGLPTIAVYPNATVSFTLPKDSYPGFGGGSFVDLNGMTLGAQLFDSGSMTLVKSTSSAVSGFPLGTLPVGDYILRVNATWGASYTVDYYGIQQIQSVDFSEGGITISIGSPAVQMNTISGGGQTDSGPDLETWPLTLTSPTVVRDVNLSATSVISGDWIQFLPSYLPEVGPNGTQAEMLLNGAVRPFVDNDISNVTMIIQATGSGGATGEVGLPLEDAGGSIVFHSLASGQQFETPTWSVTQDQNLFAAVSLIYDPTGQASNQSLPVTVSIAGLYEGGGSIVPLPSWLQFSVPTSSTNLSIAPYDPLVFTITTSSAASAPIGGYTLVLDVQVGGVTLTLFAPVVVVAPIYM